MTTLCPGLDCQVRIAWDLIKHFVWFDNPQSIRPEDCNSTRDCFLNTIHVEQMIFPLEWIWFQNDERLNFEEEEILSGLVYDSNTVPNAREDDEDLIYLDQTEKNSTLLNLSSDSPG